MKHIRNLLTMSAFLSLVIFISCGGGGGDDEPDTPPAARATGVNLSAGTWVPQANGVTFEGSTIRTEWEDAGFTLSFNVTTVGQEELGGTFTVTNVPTDAGADAALIWPTSGTWTFNDIENPGAGISRVAGGVTQNIEVNVSTTALTLTFTVDDPNARTEGFLDSPWTFNMVPQQ